MRVVDVARLRAEGHAAHLAKIILTTRAAAGGTIEEPVLLRGAMDASRVWASRSAFVARFGELRVDVTHAGARGFEWARRLPRKDHRFILGGQTDDVRLATLSLRELDHAIDNGSISEESYCFHDVAAHRPLIDALVQLTSIDDALLMQRHGPRGWKAKTRRAFLASTELCDAVRGVRPARPSPPKPSTAECGLSATCAHGRSLEWMTRAERLLHDGRRRIWRPVPHPHRCAARIARWA